MCYKLLNNLTFRFHQLRITVLMEGLNNGCIKIAEEFVKAVIYLWSESCIAAAASAQNLPLSHESRRRFPFEGSRTATFSTVVGPGRLEKR